MLWNSGKPRINASEAVRRAAVKLYCTLLCLQSDVRGSAMVEYALMAAGVGLAGAGMATMVGGDVAYLLQDTQNTLCMQFKTLCIR